MSASLHLHRHTKMKLAFPNSRKPTVARRSAQAGLSVLALMLLLSQPAAHAQTTFNVGAANIEDTSIHDFPNNSQVLSDTSPAIFAIEPNSQGRQEQAMIFAFPTVPGTFNPGTEFVQSATFTLNLQSPTFIFPPQGSFEFVGVNLSPPVASNINTATWDNAAADVINPVMTGPSIPVGLSPGPQNFNIPNLVQALGDGSINAIAVRSTAIDTIGNNNTALFHVASTENGTPAARPALTYTVVPEPSGTMLAGVFAIFAATIRRRTRHTN